MLEVIETKKEPTATIHEMAVLNFVGDDQLTGISDKELMAICRERADDIFNLSYLSLGMLRLDKDRLVESIRKSVTDGNDHIWEAQLKNLEWGQDQARNLLNFLESAEARLMVALATVAEETPDGPGGGEELPREAVAS